MPHSLITGRDPPITQEQESMESAESHRLSRVDLFFFGLADMPIQMALIPLYALIPNYYNVDMGLSLTAVGSVWLLARLFDGITDPLIGWLSDHTRTRWGRRRVWMVASIPILGLAIFKLFIPEPPVTIAYLFGWLVVLWIGWTMLFIPYYSWAAELSPDYHERTRITGWRSAIGMVANIASKAVPVVAIYLFDFGGTRETLLLIAIMMLILLPTSIGLTVYKVPERRDFLPAKIPILPGLKVLAKNIAFRRLILAFFSNQVGTAAMLALTAYFVRGVLQDDQNTILTLLVVSSFTLTSIPFWMWFGRRYDKHRAWCFGILGYAFIHAGHLLLGAGDYYYSLPIAAAAAFMSGAGWVMPHAMKADVIDVDTIASGEDRAAWMFAVWSFASKIAYSVGPWFALTALAIFGFNVETAANPSVQDVIVLKALFVGIPLVTYSIAASMTWNFPLTSEAHQAIREEVSTARRAYGHSK